MWSAWYCELYSYEDLVQKWHGMEVMGAEPGVVEDGNKESFVGLETAEDKVSRRLDKEPEKVLLEEWQGMLDASFKEAVVLLRCRILPVLEQQWCFGNMDTRVLEESYPLPCASIIHLLCSCCKSRWKKSSMMAPSDDLS